MSHLTTHKNREYSYLRTYKVPLHLSRILYRSALFMQNKPNSRKSQMNISSLLTMDYANLCNWTLGENKPNQTQFQHTTPKEREEKKVLGKLLKKAILFFSVANPANPALYGENTDN